MILGVPIIAKPSDAREYGLMLPDGTAPDAFMAYELIPGSLNNGGEFHLSAPEFELAETDNAGYEKFHKEFMSKNYQESLCCARFGCGHKLS